MTSEVRTLEDVRNKAREKLKGICGVYKDCDGDPRRLCQGQSYGRAVIICLSFMHINHSFLCYKL